MSDELVAVSLTAEHWADVVCALGWADAKSVHYSDLAKQIEHQVT